MCRTIARAVARRQYDRFSRDWRREKRMAGAWGRPGRKPTFSQWYHMHEGDSGMMGQSTPSDVQEYLGLDPWASERERKLAPELTDEFRRVLAAQRALEQLEDGTERGVVTIPIIGEDE